MHPGKKQTREIDKGIVAGKNDMLCTDLPARSFDPILLNGDDRGVLVNGQRPGDVRQKAQGMELRLPSKADRPGGRKGQLRLPHEGGGQPQRRGGLRFRLKLLAVIAVDISVAFLKGAVDAFRLDQTPVFLDCRLVGHGVLLRAVPAKRTNQLLVDQPVLRGDFCRRVPGLAAGDPPGTEHDDLTPGVLQQGGGQNPGKPCANDGDFCFNISAQRRAFRDLAALTPNRIHKPLPIKKRRSMGGVMTALTSLLRGCRFQRCPAPDPCQ